MPIDFLFQIFLHKFSDRAVRYILENPDKRLWPKLRDLLLDVLKRRGVMTTTDTIDVDIKLRIRLFQFISCDTGEVLGHCAMVAEDDFSVFNEAKFQIFSGREWSNYDLAIPNDKALEYVRRSVEYEIKELFVVRPGTIDLSG